MTAAPLGYFPASLSATLILARQSSGPIETYLLRRSGKSAFMPGSYVFPGGRVDADDIDVDFWQAHMDLPADRLSLALDGPLERRLPLAVAAIRETWEEAGLLLASPNGHSAGMPPRTSEPPVFSQWIQALDLRLCLSRLGRWSRWVTPQVLRHRFNTYFFLAAVEDGETCQPDGREVVDGLWITPLAALARNLAGTLPLSPPTLVTLHQLLAHDDLEGLVERTRRQPWPPVILPRWLPLEEGAIIIEPWDPAYGDPHITIDLDRMENDLLPVGAPFSRLWIHKGHCRPVKSRPEACIC
ncbi:Hydrolase, NUDIX family [Desulfosarcina cetonica]|nr:Hydrolase, NUDIX family [Desulfosarcina cetonica]